MVPNKLQAVNTETVVDHATGEVVKYVYRENKAGERVPVVQYDQDAADLERWILHGFARRLLHGLELKEKRRKVRFSEFAWFSEVETKRVKSVLVRERFFVEAEMLERSSPLLDGSPGPGVDGPAVALKRGLKYRVADCCRVKTGGDNPEVWYSPESARASYHNVGVCGSVWTCPVCSRRINLERQRMIQAAYDLVIDQGQGDALMVTLTIKHGLGDDLGELLGKMKNADRVLQRSLPYKKIIGYTRTDKGQKTNYVSPLAYVGRVSATEITHGKNGWHPHVHQLWFFDRKLTADELKNLRKELFAEWKKACVAVGLPAPLAFDRRGHAVGVDIRRAWSAAEYMAKFGSEREWGPEKEIANQHVKGARNGGRTPFQLLYDYGQGDKQSGALFATFAAATLGRHQLEFSKRLRARLLELGLAEVLASDEALAMKKGEDSKRLGSLSDDDFNALKGAEVFGIEAFGTLLHLAKHQGFDLSVKWLRALPSYKGKGSATGQAFTINDLARLKDRFWAYCGFVDDLTITGVYEDQAAVLAYETDLKTARDEWRRLLAAVGEGLPVRSGSAAVYSVPF